MEWDDNAYGQQQRTSESEQESIQPNLGRLRFGVGRRLLTTFRRVSPRRISRLRSYMTATR